MLFGASGFLAVSGKGQGTGGDVWRKGIAWGMRCCRGGVDGAGCKSCIERDL